MSVEVVSGRWKARNKCQQTKNMNRLLDTITAVGKRIMLVKLCCLSALTWLCGVCNGLDVGGASTRLYQLQQQRTRMLKKLVSFGATLTAFSVSTFAVDLPKTFDDGAVSFKHTEDLVVNPKPLQTHGKEVYLKSETTKGFNAGVTVDKVKINSIEEFATPSDLAKRVVDVEKSKDGVFEADIISYGESKTPISASGRPAYDIEYKIESSHGNNHYVIKTSVVNKKLYVFTVATKEDSFAGLSDTARAIVDSFQLTAE